MTGVVVVVMVGGRVHPERGGWWIDGCVGGRECWRPRAVRVGVDDFIQSSLGIIGRANPKLFNWRPNRDDPREQWMIGLVIGFCGFFNLFLSGLVYIYIYFPQFQSSFLLFANFCLRRVLVKFVNGIFFFFNNIVRDVKGYKKMEED